MKSPTKLFESLKNELKEKASSRGTFGNPNILKLKQGYSYKLRLLWLPPADGVERTYPMINQYVHTYWDDNAVGQKSVTVYCKTSQYDEDETPAGWSCPVCKKSSALYKEYQAGSQSAKELYEIARRSFRGYVPVYVIDGPEEDIHKVKILQYTKMFKDYFSENIFGMAPKKAANNNDEDTPMIDESEVLGIQAFTYFEPDENAVHTQAYNFLVTVGTKNVPDVKTGKMIKMPDYKIKFSKNLSEIDFNGQPITTERFLNLSDEIGFDRDLMLKSSNAELEKYVHKYIETNVNNNELQVNNELDDEDVDEEPSIPTTPAKSSKETTNSTLIEDSEEDGEAKLNTKISPSSNKQKSSDDDFDVDELLKDI